MILSVMGICGPESAYLLVQLAYQSAVESPEGFGRFLVFRQVLIRYVWIGYDLFEVIFDQVSVFVA
ncbi:hypothetical protein HKCCE3408_09495 [Rhodobacterales bacterium HKCCE3408]|nr:hypothetical protein [Rhodobacterales bacterium HKCCE3408]